MPPKNDKEKNYKNKSKMTQQEIKERMDKIDRECVYNHDPERISPEDWHYEADHLLCDVLKQNGYEELVEWFEKQLKWYS